MLLIVQQISVSFFSYPEDYKRYKRQKTRQNTEINHAFVFSSGFHMMRFHMMPTLLLVLVWYVQLWMLLTSTSREASLFCVMVKPPAQYPGE